MVKSILLFIITLIHELFSQPQQQTGAGLAHCYSSLDGPVPQLVHSSSTSDSGIATGRGSASWIGNTRVDRLVSTVGHCGCPVRTGVAVAVAPDA